MNNQRKLKVYYVVSEDNPKIQLSGNWLRELGFHVGDHISVQCKQGMLVIRNIAKNGGDAQ